MSTMLSTYEDYSYTSNSEHTAMLWCHEMLLKQDPKKSAINPHRFDKLITALRTAIDNGDASNKGPTLMKYLIHLDLHWSSIIQNNIEFP